VAARIVQQRKVLLLDGLGKHLDIFASVMTMS
jgi:hypothetical protein